MSAAAFLIALTAIGLMGFATQRGGTCTVAAVEEIFIERRFRRLAALVEASLWVGGGFLVLGVAGVLPRMPIGYAAGAITIAGGALLGIGAFVNRTCAFGSIARLGSGDLAFVGTLVGYFLGNLVIINIASPKQIGGESNLLQASIWFGLLCILLVIVRLCTHGWTIWRKRIGFYEHIWSPHVATTIIGLTFLVAYLSVGSWTYTDTIAELALGSMIDVMPRLLLFASLIAGAVLGAWTAGTANLIVPKLPRTGQHLSGGALMGAGGALVPGGNDGLILMGMPLLWPYAWLAFGSMCVTIYISLRLASRAQIASQA
jgi:sulfur transporter